MKRPPLSVAIALLGAALLAPLQHLAAPRIEQQRPAHAGRALLYLLPVQAPITIRQYNAHIPLPFRRPTGQCPRRTPGYLASLNGRPSAVLLPVSARL